MPRVLDGCPDDDLLARFLGGELDAARRAGVETHLDRCADCRGVLAAGVHSSMWPPIAADTSRDLAETIEPGYVIAERIELIRLIGEGGMGRIFEARQLRLNRLVAVKVMHAEQAGDSAGVRRFLREARTAARLVSPHAVRILDVDLLPSGVPYIVMDLLQGEDVQKVLARRTLSIEECVSVALEAGSALEEAHALGLIHRDLKPQNIVLSPAGRSVHATVVDFGLAKDLAPDASPASRTTGGMVVGTPRFMAPEQIRTPRDIDARVDVWGLGATLYAMLARRPPFDATTLQGLVDAILHAPVPSLRAARPEIPQALEAIVERALAKDAADRFSDVASMAAALRLLDLETRGLEATLALNPPGTQPLAIERLERTTRLDDPAGRDPVTVTRHTGPPPEQRGRFRLGEQLGAGSMGVVYRAHDPLLDRAVAVKLVRRDKRHDDTGARRQVLREARAAAALTHPNTVTIFDVGEDDDGIFIAMELLEGESLRVLVERGGIPLSVRLRWLREAALGLDAAHRRGLVHRDVKPDNLFVCRDGVLKVLDFGIAKRHADGWQGEHAAALGGPPSSETGGRIVGTPRYMAPEQRAGLPTDGRADQYAWGLVAFELVTGTRLLSQPWSTVDEAERRARLFAGEPGLSPQAVEAIVAATERDRERRLPSMEEVVRRMGDAASTAPVALTGLVEPSPKARRASWWRWATAGVLGIACLAAGARWAAHRQAVPRPPAAAATLACSVTPAVSLPLAPAGRLGFDGRGAPSFVRDRGHGLELEQRQGVALVPVPLPDMVRMGIELSSLLRVGGGVSRGKPAISFLSPTPSDRGAILLVVDEQRFSSMRLFGPLTGVAVSAFNDTTVALVTTEATGARRSGATNRVEVQRLSDDLVTGIEEGGATSPAISTAGRRAAVAYVTSAGTRFAVLDENLELLLGPITVSPLAAPPALAYGVARAHVYQVVDGRLLVATASGDLQHFAPPLPASEDVVASKTPLVGALVDGSPVLAWVARVEGVEVLRLAQVSENGHVGAPLDVARGGPFAELVVDPRPGADIHLMWSPTPSSAELVAVRCQPSASVRP